MASSYVLPVSMSPPVRSYLSGYGQHPHSHAHAHAHSHSRSHSHSQSHSHSHSSPFVHGRSPPSVSHKLGHARSHRANNSLANSVSSGHSHVAHGHTDERDHNHEYGRNRVHDDHIHEYNHDHDHDHDHDHSPDHNHNHNHDHEYDPNHTNGQGHRSLNRASVPSLLPSANGWTSDVAHTTPSLFTPTKAAFEKYYAPPEASTAVFEQVPASSQSLLTKFLLPHVAEWPLVHAILIEKDSRRIFYFMSLNFAFMLVQAFYGYVTDSLGLLSDSIHMFFDCVALAVGLFAAVASKWPPSERFPYGFGKIETLSGFANGIFLMLISVEIMVEAVERLLGGRETQRLWELFVVSTLGLLVNLVGMFSFGHHHHHGHGHSHSHDHAGGFSGLSKKHDDIGHGHDHDHAHDHHGHSDDRDHDHGHSHGHGHGHGHSHDNENMYGIYLHVLADTLGSAAVIASTVLTRVWPWSGWDPLASFLIAVLILGSAVPLVSSSARRLLLTIPDAVEYSLRETLAGVPGLRGVAGYAAPRFWIDDRSGTDDRLLGVVHVVASRGADMDDVQTRVRTYLLERNVDVVVQVEREGENEGGTDLNNNCWCGANRPLRTKGHTATHSINF